MSTLGAHVGALSLQSRLLLLTALVLGTCLGAVGWVLDRSFKAAVRAAAEQELQATAHGILGAADERGGALVFAAAPAEPRLAQPHSGLYAFVTNAARAVQWRSPSAVATGVFAPRALSRQPAPGEAVFTKVSATRFALGYTVVWETLGAALTIWVVADWDRYRGRIVAFRRNIAMGLSGAALFFALVLLTAVRWGLAPVRRMVVRIRGLEAGETTTIGSDYPPELAGLAGNLNRFITHERDSRERYRRAMDDLAHSLKTPLTVVKNAMREQPGEDARIVRHEVTRMEHTVARQLARAAVARPALPAAPLPVLPLAARVVRALQRAYVDKGVEVEVVGAPGAAGADSARDLAVRVDEPDLLDALGNLIENAFKYSRSRVRVQAVATPRGVDTVVEDDGDGIAPPMRDVVLRRGERADTTQAGQGIGLAVVAEITATYGGRLAIANSDLGGAALHLELPGGRVPASRSDWAADVQA